MEKRAQEQKDSLFFLAYGIYLATMLLSTSFFYRYFAGSIQKGLLIISLFLLILYEYSKDRLSTYSIPMIVLCAILSLIIIKDAPRKIMVFFVPFIFCARDISFKRIAIFSAIISAIVLCFVTLSSLIGIIPNHYDYWSGRPRYFLGFRYALYPSTIFFNIIALVVYEKGKNITWKLVVVLAILNQTIFYFTDSRLCCATGWVVLLISVLLKKSASFIDKKTFFKKLFVFSFPLSGLVSIVLTVKYVPYGWMTQLNNVLGNRLFYGNESIKKYGVTMFGQKIKWIGNGLDMYGKKSTEAYLYVDSLYVQILQRYGLIFLLVVLSLLTGIMYYLYLKKEWYLLYVMAILAFHGIIDDLIIHLHFNSFILLLGILFQTKLYDDSLLISEYENRI